MATRRHKNWQQRLSDVVREHRDSPFDFKNLNCLFWAFKGIKAVIDVDNMPAYDGRSDNIRMGKRALKLVDDCDTVQEVLMKRLGQTLQPIAFARPGDIVFINPDNELFNINEDMRLFGPIPGLVYGNGLTSLFLGETELREVPTLKLDSALWVS